MLLFRKIEIGRWLQSEGLSWLKPGDIPADPLSDLKTANNTLSVWLIEDNQSNLDQVITANAANLGNIKHFEYCLFDHEILSDLEIELVKTKGGSADDEVNKRWHRDIIHLSGHRLLELTKRLVPLRNQRAIVFDQQVRELIVAAVASKKIALTRLQKGVRDKIEPLL